MPRSGHWWRPCPSHPRPASRPPGLPRHTGTSAPLATDVAGPTFGRRVPLMTATERLLLLVCGQTWSRHTSLVGAAALRLADLGWQGRPPPAAPDKRARLGDRLVRGSPGGVWARDIPLYRRAVPGQRHGGTPAPCRFKPHPRRRLGLDADTVGGGIRTQRRAASPSEVETVDGL